MDSSQRICRFCYNTYDEKDVSDIEETERKLLGVLCIPLDLSITDCPVICTTCKEQIKDCDRFKKLCISTENSIKPYLEDNVKINLRSIYNCLIGSEKTSKDICRLCMQPTDDHRALDGNEAEQFSVFFSEINLNITSSVVFCMTCHGSLQKHLNFAKACLDWEKKLVKMKNFLGQDEKMSLENFLHSLKYHDMVKEERDDTFDDELHLDNIKKEMDEDMEQLLKMEEEKILAHQEQLFIKQEGIPVKTEKSDEVKEEMDVPDVNYTEDEEMDEKFMLSNNELDIKDESSLEEARLSISKTGAIDSNNNANMETLIRIDEELNFTSNPQKNTRKRKLLLLVQEASSKMGTQGKPSHESESLIKMYQCKQCNYTSSKKFRVRQHIRYKHVAPAKMVKYKCDHCNFESIYKNSLKTHVIYQHTDYCELYPCEECDYKGKSKTSLRKHIVARHTDPSKIEMYKCDKCDCKFKFKETLRKHNASRHADPSKIKKYKCSECNFEVKHEVNLKMHMVLKHTNYCEIFESKESDVDGTVYQCEHCVMEFQTKDSFKQHYLSKHSDDYVEMHQCDKCDYKCYSSSRLQEHVLFNHTNPQIKMHKCDKCNHQFKSSRNLSRHILCKHTDPAEVEKHKCKDCSFETLHKESLKKHVYAKHSKAAVMYACEECPYKCNARSRLTEHVLAKHTDRSGIKMYKCDKCEYQSKRERNLTKHLIFKHNDP